MGLAMSPDGRTLYATTGRGGSVLAVDTEKLEVTGTVKVGKRPWGIAISPDGRKLYVANGPSNDLSVIDVASMKEVARIPCGQSPWGVTVVSAPK